MSKPASYVAAGILADESPEDLVALVPVGDQSRLVGNLFRDDAEIRALKERREKIAERERANTATLLETKEHADVEEAAEALRVERERLLDTDSIRERKAKLKAARKALKVTKPAVEARAIEREKKEVEGGIAVRVAKVVASIDRVGILSRLLGADSPTVKALKMSEDEKARAAVAEAEKTPAVASSAEPKA